MWVLAEHLWSNRQPYRVLYRVFWSVDRADWADWHMHVAVIYNPTGGPQKIIEWIN